MGSGRGRVKRVRVQGVAAPSTKVRIHSDIWERFVRDQGLCNVKLASYYNIKVCLDPRDPLDAAPRQAELARELFRDFVATGAITLPPGVDADDFEFDVRKVRPVQTRDYAPISLMLRNSRKGTEQMVAMHSGFSWNDDVDMDNSRVKDMVMWIGTAARRSMEKK